MSDGYFCEKCGYVTNRKTNLDRHLARKTPCNIYTPVVSQPRRIIKENVTIINEKDNVYKSNEKGNNNRECDHCGKIFKTVNSCRSHKSQKTCHRVKPNPCECRKCYKIFKSPGSKRAHMARNTCKPVEKPPNTIQTINNTTNIVDNSTTININVTVVNPFGEETMDYIINDKEFLSKCIKNGSNGLQEVVNKVWCNKDHPENHNLQIPNRSEDIYKIWDGSKWLYQPRSLTEYPMLHKAALPLHTHYCKEFNNSGQKPFEDVRKAIMSHDDRDDNKLKMKSTTKDRKILRKMTKEIKCSLINNRTSQIKVLQ